MGKPLRVLVRVRRDMTSLLDRTQDTGPSGHRTKPDTGPSGHRTQDPGPSQDLSSRSPPCSLDSRRIADPVRVRVPSTEVQDDIYGLPSVWGRLCPEIDDEFASLVREPSRT
eukprot:scaffold225422_cov19-Prasinocladus_malaysianus.AAC.1